MLKEDAYVKVQASIYYQHYTLSQESRKWLIATWH